MKSQINKLISIFACVCLLLTALVVPTFAAPTEIAFEFGANGDASHNDGQDIGTAKSYTSGDYTLALTDVYKCYDEARDATGKSALKMGTSKLNGNFSFTAPDDVTSVIFKVAQYKSNATTVSVNGTEYTISTASANGEYTAITVDTTTTKAITFETVGSKYRCMIDSITYVIGGTTGGDEGGDEDTCNHDGDRSYEPNGDETHKVICDTCTETITATVDCVDADLNGKCDTCEGNVTIPFDPAGKTPAEIVDAAYALEGSETIDNVTLTGKVTEVTGAYDASYGNITVNIAVDGKEDKPIQCKYMGVENADAVEAGDTITVTGNLQNYNGTIQFYRPTLNNVVKAEGDDEGGDEGDDTPAFDPSTATPAEIVDAAYALEAGATINNVTLTGKVIEVIEYSAQYGNTTVKMTIEGKEDKPINCKRMAVDSETEVEVGDTITVSGTVENNFYNNVSTIQFYTPTLVNVVKAEGGEVTPPAGGDEDDDNTGDDTPAFDPTNKTAAEIVDAAYALAPGAAFEKNATLTGVITSVDDPYSEQFKNVTVTIKVNGADADKPIKCFRIKGDGADVIAVGDTITVTGIIKNYQHSSGDTEVEFDAGSSLDSYIKAEGGDEGGEDVTPPVELPAPDETNTLTITEAIELGLTKEHNTYTDEKYYVTGVIASVYDKTYGNMYIEDEDGNILTIYGTYSADGEIGYANMETKPVAGDTVTIYGKVGQYNNAAQIKNGWIVDHILGEGEPESNDPAADSVLTVKEAIDLGLSKLHNVFTDNMYYVTGEITEIYDEMYGNMRITDAEGNILTLYGTFDEDGNRFDAMEVKPEVGDTITVYGIIGQYNGTPQMKNGVFTTAPATDDGDDDGTTDGDDDGTTDGTTGGTTDGTTTGTGSTTDTNTDGATTSPDTSDNIGACAVMAIAAAAVVLYTSKKR